MRPFARLPNPPKSLPQALGPKLAPFTPTAYADIEFIEQLGDPSSNKDGHVWKVKINGTEPFYALKMVGIYCGRYYTHSSGPSAEPGHILGMLWTNTYLSL